MKVAIRVDASERIGTGHMIRCLVLGEALQARGTDVHVISADTPGNLNALVTARNFHLLQIDPVDGVEAADAELTERQVAGKDFEWLVVDHYSLGKPWEQALRPHAGRLLAIDDLCRAHDCDILVDQSYANDRSRQYRALVPADCEVLLGPQFALLGSAVAQCARQQSGTVRRVFVYFGGSDPDNLTGLAVAALCTPELEALELDVVLGSNSSYGDAVRALASTRGHATVHGFQRTIAPLMAKADLAIGAGGVTALERLAVGVPSLVVSVADNQTAGCEAMARAGLIEYLGPQASIDATLLGESIARLCGDPRRLDDMSTRGRRLVDGEGARRVVGRMVN